MAVAYVLLLYQDEPNPATARLLEKHRAETTELPFGIYALDPAHPDLESIIGGPTGEEIPPDLIPLWKGSGGKSYGATTLGGSRGAGGLYEISSNGRIRPLHDFLDAKSATASLTIVSRERSLSNILDGLSSTAPPTGQDSTGSSRAALFPTATPPKADLAQNRP
jgi:hypothetical protein